MKVDIYSKKGSSIDERQIALALCADQVEGGKISTAKTLGRVDPLVGKILSQARLDGRFGWELDETYPIEFFGQDGKSRRIIVCGLGKEADLTADRLSAAAGAAARYFDHAPESERARGRGRRSFVFIPPDSINRIDPCDALGAISSGIVMALYRFDRLKEKKSPRIITQAFICAPEKITASDARGAIKKGLIIGEEVNFAKEISNAPSNLATPTHIAALARQAAREHRKLKVKTLDRAAMKKLKMGGLLAVARGSAEEPRFVVMEYFNGADPKEAPIALVGKGVTFDTGGISLKPAANMESMKFDMSGAAAVIATARAAARLDLKVNLLALAPLTENMPGGKAIKPGDVVTAISNVTMEIVNTDAEGRLILADALGYAARHKPRHIIDIATLTGACMVALGERAAGIFGSDKQLIDALIASGARVGERLWEMPTWDEYAEDIKSSVADIKNVGSRHGGAITAALFLKRHVGEASWAHIDIAGVASSSKTKGYRQKGSSGFGPRTFIEFIRAYGR